MAVDNRLRLELPVLLPQIDDERDACVERLRLALRSQRGIDRVHLDRQSGRAVMCLHYRPDETTLESVRRAAQHAGAAITRQFQHATVHIGGMDCADCATSLEHVLGRTPGVLAVSVSYPAEKMRLEFDAQQVRMDDISRRVGWMGYAFEPAPKPSPWLRGHGPLILSLVCGGLLAAGVTGPFLFGLPAEAAIGLFILAYVAGGLETARHGFAAARHLRFDIDFLMIMAALGSAFLGHWAEGAFLLFFFSLGHALEQQALGLARGNLDALRSLVPQSARVRHRGDELERPVDDLLRGDQVVVRPGERLPADGRVLEGTSTVDRSMLTGESQPVELAPGDEAFAGSVNGDGALVIEVTRLARDSTLARVVHLVETAQTQKSSVERLIERFSRTYVPLVLAGTLAVALIPPALGWLSLQESLFRALTLLVAASPCALAISTPAAVLSATARAARAGILIKGGRQLEQLGRVRAMAFDKTGTLTHGSLAVSEVESFGDAAQEEVLALAASVESQLVHPLARAVIEAAGRQSVTFPVPEGVQAAGGRGAEGRVDGVPVFVGSPAWLAERGLAVSGEVASALARQRAQGRSVMLVARRDQILGLIGFTDSLRPEANAVLDRLADLGVTRREMLTGDHQAVAQRLAGQLDLTGYRAELLPEAKVEAVRQMAQGDRAVAMVGDGVNDAPAMAQASVGIAVSGAASDVALETADVVLLADGLRQLPLALDIGRQTRRVIAQNLVLALGVMAGLVIAGAAGWTSIGPAIVVHESSTLLVVVNALRLLRLGDATFASPVA